MIVGAMHGASPVIPDHVPAMASTAVRASLTRPSRSVAVLGSSSSAIWLDAGDDVIVVATREAVRLPNGVGVALPDLGVFAGFPASVGGGGVRLGSAFLEVTRWWVPRPALPQVAVAELSGAAAQLPVVPSGIAVTGLGRALTERDTRSLLRAARGIVGWGEGLTPSGDDYLAAALATARCLASAIGDDSMGAMLDEAAPELAEVAEATTAFSASLLRHALRGNVATPLADLLRALTGGGDVGQAAARLSGVGHTSGPALLAGVGCGARSVIRGTGR